VPSTSFYQDPQIVSPFRPGALVIATLDNPREKFWGAILHLAPKVSACAELTSRGFDDLATQIKNGEAFTSGVVFFPMHRLERMELDLPEGDIQSLSQRFAQKTGQDPAPILASEFLNSGGRSRRREIAVNLRQILTAPNQLTLLRMIFLPFIVINLVKHDFKWALALFVLAGLSDGLDGLLARTLHQQTLLGQYLDPIADKLLMSTMFLVLSIEQRQLVPWKYTIVVFSRDISILLLSGVLFMIAGLRDFRPSIFGKANTFAQVGAIFFVSAVPGQTYCAGSTSPKVFLRATFIFTIVSAVHYAFLVQHRLHGPVRHPRPSSHSSGLSN
jgi:cardiolipin synthase